MTDHGSKFIGSIPGYYDSVLGPHVFYGFADDLAARVAARNPNSVLELASGTGIVTRRLRNLLPDSCRLIASDLNRSMLDVAKTKFENGERVEFKLIDANDIEVDDEIFDVVVCQFGIMFFPDKGRSNTEVRRVLKSGGSYIFSTWDSLTENLFGQITQNEVEKFFPNDPPTFYRAPFSYHDRDEIMRSLADAQFSDVSSEYLSLESAIPSASQFARGLVFGNPLYDEILNRGGNPDEVCASLAAALEKELGGKMTLRALVFEAS